MVTLKEIFKIAYSSPVISEGAWGYAPSQNDGALDLFNEVFRPKEIQARLFKELLQENPADPNSAWKKACLAKLALQAFTNSEGFGKHLFKKEYAEAALKHVQTCLASQAWQEEWKNPEELRRELQSMGSAFKLAMLEAEAQ